MKTKIVVDQEIDTKIGNKTESKSLSNTDIADTLKSINERTEQTSNEAFTAGITDDKAPTAKQAKDASDQALTDAKTYADNVAITAGSMDSAIYVPKIETNESSVEVLNTLVAPRLKTDQLFDKTAITSGYSITDGSEIIEETGSSISDYIDIVDTEDYEFVNFQAAVYFYILFFNAAKEIVGRDRIYAITGVDTKQITIPQSLNVTSCRFETEGSTVLMSIDDIYFRKVSKYIPNQSDYTYKEYSSTIDLDENIESVEHDENLVNEDTIIPYNSGNVVYAFLYFNYEVEGGETLQLYCKNLRSNTGDNVFEYDENGTEITAYNVNMNSDKYSKISLSATTKSVFIKIASVNSGYYTNITDIRNDISICVANQRYKELRPLEEIIEFGGLPIKNTRENEHLYNEVGVVCGDSIAAFGNSSYPSLGGFPKRLDALEICNIHNYACGSARFTDYATTTAEVAGVKISVSSMPYSTQENNTVSNQIRTMVSEGVVPDWVILTGCTNDAHDDKLIGDLETAVAAYNDPSLLDLTQFYNFCVWATVQLRAVNPDVQIFFASPPRNIRTTLASVMPKTKEYADAFAVLCVRMGLPLLDFYNCGIIDFPTTIADNVYFYDDLHLSEFGIIHQSKFSWNFIVNNYNKSLV